MADSHRKVLCRTIQIDRCLLSGGTCSYGLHRRRGTKSSNTVSPAGPPSLPPFFWLFFRRVILGSAPLEKQQTARREDRGKNKGISKKQHQPTPRQQGPRQHRSHHPPQSPHPRKP